MRFKNVGRAIATATAALFAIAAMGGAFGMTKAEHFYDCMENTNGSAADRERCCAYAGGSWVELYDADGEVIDAFCHEAEEGGEESEIRTQPTRTTTTSGTYQQTSTPAPTKTTSGTYQYQQASPTPAPTTTTSRTTTSGTYSR